MMMIIITIIINWKIVMQGSKHNQISELKHNVWAPIFFK